MMDYMKGRNYEPVFHQDAWVPVASDEGDDWISIGINKPGQSFYDTED